MRIKVYFSKTNRTNPDDESMVRSVLSDFNDIEIVEYKSGSRNLANIKGCDYLIIFPNYIDKHIDSDWVGLSLSQYDEYCAFKDVNYSMDNSNIMFVTDTNQHYRYIRFQNDFDCDESDDPNNYLYIENTIRGIFEDRFGLSVSKSHL